MLINCPECSHIVSDKAVSCPQCGFPMQSATVATLQLPPIEPHLIRKRTKKKHKKLPNGYGSIQKLSGKRSHPYAAYPPTKEFSISGSPVRQEAIGYYTTWYAAYDALSEYNSYTDQDREERKRKADVRSLTFAQVYELYYADKFKRQLEAQSHDKTVKKTSMQTSIISAYKNSTVLHDKVFSQLRKPDFQKVIDDCPLKRSSKELLLCLYSQMSKFALQNDYIDKNYAQFCSVTAAEDDESGVPFSPSELKILWADSSNPVSQMILIMIYSGFRISAFEKIEVNLSEGYFKGGVKTAAGKNRIVPIHSAVLPFVQAGAIPADFSSIKFRKDLFYPKLNELGISVSSSGTKHTPHDCRHTFSWLCDKYGVNDVTKHILMGHAIQGDVEKRVYTHRRIEELREELEKICR